MMPTIFRGGPLDGQEASDGTSRYVLIPDYEGSFVCETPDGHIRCFPMHRYERKKFEIVAAEPYKNDDGVIRFERLVYCGKEPATPCGPIVAGDRP